jgi:microcystin-dependent protein
MLINTLTIIQRFIFIIVLIFPSIVLSDPVNTFTFQGRLENSDGSPVSSTLNMTFRIYDNQSTGLWSETLPVNYLLCDGAAVSRTTYADLFAAIGTTYGTGDGSITFNLPNTKGKVLVGYNSSESEFNSMGKTGGEKTHALTTTEMPSHYHYVSLTTSTNGAHTHSYKKGDPSDNSITEASGSYDEYDDISATTGSAGNHSHTVSGNTGSKGSSGAHNNLQPYITMNYIIKY